MPSMRGTFEAVGYRPHATQRSIHIAQKDCRFRVVCGGRRGGKSAMGGHELTVRALEAWAKYDELSPHGKRMEYWIVGPNYVDSEKEFRVLFNDLEKLGIPMDSPGTYYHAESGNMHISCFGGRFLVHAKSAAHPDSLIGEGLHGVILAEAAKLKPSVWSKLIRPTLADYRGWALMTSTPEGKNWFYDAWQFGQHTRDHLDWFSTRAPAWVNPYVYPGGRQDPEILSMESEMAAEKFNQEIGADFTEFVGRVFKDFDEELHVDHCPYDPRWPVYLCADFGYTNPTVILAVQIDIWDNVWVCKEYYETHRTAHEVGRDILLDESWGPILRNCGVLYPDPEDPASANELSQQWNVTAMRGTGGELSTRLDLIRRWLKVPYHLEHPDVAAETAKAPKLKVDFSCKNLIREMQEYRYPDTKDEQNRNPSDKPLKKNDHAPEALGRFFAGHLKRENPRGRARQRKARTR